MEQEKVQEKVDLVPVYSASDPVTAHIIKNALEEQDIRAFIEDENQAAVTGLMGIEVRVLVETHQVEKARRLIEEHEKLVQARGEQAEEMHENENATPAV